MSNETERKAFEEWAASVGYHTTRDMFEREKYQSTLTWELWQVWQAAAAYQREQNAYRLAVDTGLVCAHIGVTNPEDDYETAIKKLNDLICWSIQVDRDLDREHVKGLVEALEDIANDYSDRFDMESPSTNPGMKVVVENAREALATYKAQEGK